MKPLLRRRPTPALVIALLALFISLSGVSYGVATGFIDSREIKNNEIRSLDIRDNQIRSRDIRNNEVRGIDIRNSTVQSRDIAINAVRGEDVKEDTLAKVPSALLADSATNAGSVDTLKIIPITTMAEGDAPVTLATQGPLTLLARCQPNGSETRASLAVDTSEDNSAADGEATFSDGDLDAAEPPLELAFLTTTNAGLDGSRVVASAPSGKAFAGLVSVYANASGAGTCKFHGFVTLQG